MDGGYLHDLAGEFPFDGLPDDLRRQVIRVFPRLRLAFQIEGGRAGAQDDRPGIFLFLRHIVIDAFGEPPRAEDEQSRCKRVKGAGMANLPCLYHRAQFAHDIERGPLQWFVDKEHLALLEEMRSRFHRREDSSYSPAMRAA